MPVPQPLDVINVEDSNDARVRHVNPIRSNVHAIYITFGGYSLRATAKHKRTGTLDRSENRRPASKTGGFSKHRLPSTSGPHLNDESKEFVNIFDIVLTGSLVFDEQKKETNEELQEAMQLYFLVYIAAFEDVLEVHQEAATEDLIESVGLVLTDLP